MPRDCLTIWPTGTVKPDIPEPWAQKAADMAAWVVLMEARIKRNKTNIAALTREMGVARGSIDSLMRGQAWPGFDLFTSMARAMHYWDIWVDLGRNGSSKNPLAQP
jgi:lambda repressor-like predicted transcriptional regulator